MSHLPLSLMNRFNKTGSDVFRLWMLYFQMILFTEYSVCICFMFIENRLVYFLFNIKNDLKKSAHDDISTLFQFQLCTVTEIKKIFPLCPDSHFEQEQFRNCIAHGKNSYIVQKSENAHFAQDNSRIVQVLTMHRTSSLRMEVFICFSI